MTTNPFAPIEIPACPPKPRRSAMTSILDKGLGPAQVGDLIATASEWIDVVKLGWGTARLMPGDVLGKKVDAYHAAGIAVCTGGTFLEVAYAQDKVSEFLAAARSLGLRMVEVSNGVHPMTLPEKLGLIQRVREAGFTVWSEVGKKDARDDARLTVSDRLQAVQSELEAGAERVIMEARESGTVGIYDSTGKPHSELLHRLVETVGLEPLVFEAPRKDQQVWLIRTFGSGVNLANVPPDDAISIATIRTGLRGDTFADVHLHGVEVFVEVGATGAVEARRRGGVIIVIDALRASGTIVAALGSGMASVRPVATPEECVGDVTAGERGGFKLPNVDHGNSPTELLAHDYRGRALVLTTTNCTECILTAAAPENVVLIGTTVNRAAVARAAVELARRKGSSVTLLLAGRGNREAIEDSLAAGEIFRAMTGARIHGESLPSAPALEPAFFDGDSGRNLVELGYADDVRFCARLDVYDVVPIYRDGVLTPLS